VIHEIERLDLLHDRTERQPAAVRVARERAGECETIGASLLLDDAPRLLSASLELLERAEERRPLDPALHRDVPRAGSKATTRASERVSMSSVPSPNCWPPIECRPPAIEIGMPAARA
jgi:hypothetical protein